MSAQQTHGARKGNIRILVFADKESLGRDAARRVATRVSEAVEARGAANVVFATGVSQYEFLDALREMDAPWERISAFHLDEYLGLRADHPASFRRYLRERLFNHLPFAAVHLLEGDAPDPAAEAARYEALLRGVSIDVACIGIGENGHLAFNDPPAGFESSRLVNVVTLDRACRQQQVGEGHFATIEDVPQRALSLSIPAILSARVISCVVPDRRKAEAVRAALEGPITPDCPASALRRHGEVYLYLDQESASRLSVGTLA
jgi:glucosamine-6-phosphate deaminase